MKKYLSLVVIGLSLMLSGCSKDDNNNPDTPPTGDTGKVRYEATVSDPENFKLLIHYTVGVDISSEAPEEAAKEILVESPFTFEQEAKQGTYLWLSAYPVPKNEENLENLQLPKKVEVNCISLTVVKIMQWFNIYSDRKIIDRTDTFSTNTGRKPGKNLIPNTSGFCRTWTKRKHYYDTKK
jgi:hypothetical protein